MGLSLCEDALLPWEWQLSQHWSHHKAVKTCASVTVENAVPIKVDPKCKTTLNIVIITNRYATPWPGDRAWSIWGGILMRYMGRLFPLCN